MLSAPSTIANTRLITFRPAFPAPAGPVANAQTG